MKPKRGRPRKSTISMETEVILTDLVNDDTTCKFCAAEFLDESDLLVHIDQLHSSQNTGFISCGFCTLKSKCLDEYALHIRNKHLRDFKVCNYCFRIYTDAAKLSEHQKKHGLSLKKNEYACSDCRMLFKDTYSLEIHEYEKHRDNGDGVILKECLSHLSAVLNSNASVLLRNIHSDFTFNCRSCRFRTLDWECYILHLQKECCKCVVCDKCCVVNKNHESMHNHMLKHKKCHNYLNNDDLTKLCTECNQLIDILYWKKHVNVCKVIKCASCNILFDTLHDLTMHQNVEHPLTVTVEKCKYCLREFVGKVTLNKHLDKVHKNTLHLYKYHCLICSTPFQHPKKLFGHYYSTHKDLEPYTCKICNEKFRIRKRFTLHIKMEHDGAGFVEFDKNYHVFFSNQKSEHPFVPHVIEDINTEGKDDNVKSVEVIEDNNTEGKDDEVKSVEVTNQNSDKSKTEESMQEAEMNPNNNEAIILNIDSDAMNPTETEVDQKEEPTKVRTKRKRKLKPVSDNDDSDNEPLIKIKKRVKGKRFSKPSHNAKVTKGMKKFTCKVCQKYCYTYQNYVHHTNLHENNEVKCIKCPQVFTSRMKLRRHIEKNHSKSKLTDTLKMILDRKKNNVTNKFPDKSKSANFFIKMKKVDAVASVEPAKLTKLPDNGMSLQNFIENFTPDSSISKDVDVKNKVIIETNVSLTVVKNAPHRVPKIKMVKFTPKPAPTKTKLAMPVKFKPCPQQSEATIKIVHTSAGGNQMFRSHHNSLSQNGMWTEPDHYEEVADEEREIEIPEMSQEFTVLESANEGRPLVTDHKVIIPKLPKVLDDVRIGHLLPEAPYYKIVRVKDVLKAQKEEKVVEEKVVVPGKKLVTANPLAHLLKDKNITPVQNDNKKGINFEAAIAKALLRLEAPGLKKKSKNEVITKEK